MTTHQPTNIGPVEGRPQSKHLDPQQKQRLEKAVKQFEAIFVNYMLKSMRNTIQKADISNEGLGGDLLEGMFDIELANHLSRNSRLGVAEMLYKQMTGEDLPRNTSPSVRTVPQIGTGHQPDNRLTRVSGRPEHTFSNTTLQQRIDAFGPIIEEAAEQYNLDANLIKAVIATESAARPDARSKKDAKGLMQLIDSTAVEMGVRDVWDPRQNIHGGAKYLRLMLDRFQGDQTLALASYNAGPRAVERHGGIPPYKETKEYVTRVENYMRNFEEQEVTARDDN